MSGVLNTCWFERVSITYVNVPMTYLSYIPTAKETPVPTTEAERTIKNGKPDGAAEGLAESIAESFEGLATIARSQAEVSFKQGENVERVFKDQSIATTKAAEAIGLSVLSTLADITAPFLPQLPSVMPVSNLETLVDAGFDIAQQLLDSERTLTEAATRIVVRR